MMSLGALCVFIWGVLSGAFHGADDAAVRFYEMEMESDENRDHAQHPSKPTSDARHPRARLEEYGGGAIEARHGYIPIWLLVVYAVLFVWGLYYIYPYWGGLGPGRIAWR